MTKYRQKVCILALAALFAFAGRVSAGPLDKAFAPRACPGVEYAALPVPVVHRPPAAALRHMPAPCFAALKSFRLCIKEFFCF